MGFFRAKVLLWPLILIPALIIAGLVAAVFSGALNAKTVSTFFASSAESTHTSETVMYLLPKQEVILASAHIQGVERAENDGKLTLFPWLNLPLHEQVVFVQYDFDAQLGIDGSEVTITGDPEVGFTVHIPEFRYLGNDKPRFADPLENSRGFTWFAEKISVTEMHNAVLSGRNQAQYVEANADMLRAQAELFYTTVIRSVSPETQLTFVFVSDDTATKD